MKKINVRLILSLIVLPIVYAFVLRILFGLHIQNDLFTIMSVSFLFLMPFVMGIITVYFSPTSLVRKLWYRLFAPWLPICLFLITTITFSIEGWACWMMILPLFLITASLGGLYGAFLNRKLQEKKLRISLLVLLPFFASPIEHCVAVLPGTYEAYTFIDIKAPASRIWKNVTRVSTIDLKSDRGWLSRRLGFPRPVRAELNYEGVGASREAVFTNGLVFHETVTEYAPLKKMVFNIRANPHEIPSTTMDEHIVLGGNYFDVLNGTYRLEQVDATTSRLHLYSHFKLRTNFNFYASWWARWIMKDIQNNILQVEKYRSESKG